MAAAALKQVTRSAVSQTSKIREWLCILPDMPNVLDRRIAVRPQHSPNFVKLHQEGWVSWAGPVFDQTVPKEHPRRPFCGSVLVVNDVSPESIKEKLSDDIYVKQGIWDLGRAEFIPFDTEMRAP